MAAERRWDQQGTTEDATEGNVAVHTQAVPKTAVAFLKELLTVTDPAVR